MSDTFFTNSPHWGWYIVGYFFIGGIAGGAMFLASCLRLFGQPADRPLTHRAHYLAVTGAVISGLLLTVDLTRPERFWRMLTVFKPESPMSVGAWGVLVFGLVAGLAAAVSFAETRPLTGRAVSLLRRRGVDVFLAVTGAVLGLFLAGYTGILLAVTNRPLWADSIWLGAVSLFAGLSTAGASLALMARGGHPPAATIAWLGRFHRRVVVLEALAIAGFVVSLGPLARVFIGGWGILLLGVIGAGIVAPALEGRGGPWFARWAPILVLVGGLGLRVVVIFSSHGIEPVGAGIAGK
jgi:formate-dependent nitrite reductase membrane component NrfD